MNNTFKLFVLVLITTITQLVADSTDRDQPVALCPLVESVNVITGEYTDATTDLFVAGPRPATLQRCFFGVDSGNPCDGLSWHFNLPGVLSAKSTHLPESSPIDTEYAYQYDSCERLIELKVFNKQKTKVFNQLNFEYYIEDEKHKCKVSSIDGQSAIYSYVPTDVSRSTPELSIESFTDPLGYVTRYEYQRHPQERKMLIKKVERPDGGYLETEYYTGKHNNVGGKLVTIDDPVRDRRIGRVKLQKAPLGPGGSPVITQCFFYENGYTDVVKSNGQKIRYHYSGDQNITKVETFNGETLYRVERFFWGVIGEGLQRRITCRSLEDAAGNVFSCTTYRYDSSGQILEERFYGNISGANDTSIELDNQGYPIDNGVEFHATLYEYDAVPGHMVKKVEPSGKVTRYIYEKSTGRNTAVYVGDGENTLIRQFFYYNEDGLLVKTITDDGFFEGSDSLHGVTERHIARFTLKESMPSIGMPEVIEESYFDINSGTEHFLKRTHNTYSSHNQIVKQEIYDSNGDFAYSLDYQHDLKGRCLFRRDSDGTETTHQFDAKGNQILERLQRDGILLRETLNDYDVCGRLVRSVNDDGSQAEQSTFKYDAMNNKIASIDSRGNKTIFKYDDLGRLTHVIHPEVLDENESPICPVVENKYDIANNIIETVDPRGYKTVTHYNAKGSPIEIYHPDGTSEGFEYYFDGSLKRKVTKNGMSTIYYRDIFSRVIKEEVYAPSGKLISKVTSEYGAFHLYSNIDKNGVVNKYDYDAAGRQVSSKRITEEGIEQTEFEYDELGRLHVKKEWFGDNPNDFSLMITERDIANNIVEIRIEDSMGKILRKRDSDEQELMQKRGGVEWKSTEETFNDEGHLSTVETVTDCNGNTLVAYIDALGRQLRTQKKTPFGDICQEVFFRYDACGNKVKEIHSVIDSEGNKSDYIVSWSYGPGNRIDTVTEGDGSRSQRTTAYQYNEYGQLETIIKPDRTQIYHYYNELGLPVRFYSSDATIDYEYEYDVDGNVVEVIDRVHGSTTKRVFNSSKAVVQEKLANGATIAYKYDKQGRKVKCTLQDGSSVNYHYDAVNLNEVERVSSDGSSLYSYKYLDYDLDGKLYSAEMIDGLSTLSYEFSFDGECIAVQSPFWSQELEFDGAKRLVLAKVSDICGESISHYEYNDNSFLTFERGEFDAEYTYDSLGNRKSSDQQNSNVNDVNEVTFDAVYHYVYDFNGNMTRKISETHCTDYTYDALNRLISVNVDDRVRVKYVYDSLNRRLEKRVEEKSKESQWIEKNVTRYMYDGNDEIGDFRSDGSIQTLRVLGQGFGSDIGAAVAIEIGSNIYAPIHDQRGSLCSLVDIETGLVAECYRYSAFGEETIYDGTGAVVEPKDTINPWRFSSKRVDEETGLIFFGKRYYQPDLGRWTTLDPIGYKDGINRYLFTHNNPLTNIDHYGLFSFSSIWNSVVSFFGNCISGVMDVGSKIFGLIRSETHYLQKIQPDLTKIFEDYFGKGFLTLNGYYAHPLETGIYGEGEVNDKVRITLLNGIANVRSYYGGSLEFLTSAHGGVNIHYIFRPTEGWTWDVLKGLLIRLGYVSSYARELAATWKEMIAEMGGVDGGGTIIHYCHSLGGADTANAASLLTPEERKMIKVISFGSAIMIPDNMGFAEVVNYVSVRDGVSMFVDPFGYFKGLVQKDSNVIFIGSFLGVPLVDHALAVNTYTEMITNLGHVFLQMYAYSGSLY
ncbi:MAG: RHS repeat-associated core domain-containing protein [Chlamydiota bacterium]|nr:RHS repeat-associated core domain-containing protein [Chlamydiota bacterium]